MFDPERPERYRPPYASLPPEWRDPIYGPPAKQTWREVIEEFERKWAEQEKKRAEGPPAEPDSGVAPQ